MALQQLLQLLQGKKQGAINKGAQAIQSSRNFFTKKLNDDEGFFQKGRFTTQPIQQTIAKNTPKLTTSPTGDRYVSFGQFADKQIKPYADSMKFINQMVSKPFANLESRSGELRQAAGTPDFSQRVLNAFPKAAEIAGEEFIGGITGGGAVQRGIGKGIGIATNVLAKPVVQLGAGLSQLTDKATRKKGIENTAKGAVGSVLTATGATTAKPAFMGLSAGLGATFGGGAKMVQNISEGKSITEGVPETMARQAIESGARSVPMSAVLKVTQPMIQSVGVLAQQSQLFNKLPDTVKAGVLDRVLGSVMNVGEGIIIDKALGLDTDAISLGIDTATGAWSGTGANKLTPEQRKAITQAIRNNKDLFEKAVRDAGKTLGDQGGFIKPDEVIGNKNDPTSIADILSLKQKQIEAPKETNITKEQFDIDRIAKKHKVEPATLQSVMAEYGFTPKQVERALNADSDNPNVKNKIGYMIRRIQTGNFVNPIPQNVRDTSVDDSLLLTEPPAPPRKLNDIFTPSDAQRSVEPIKPVETTLTQPVEPTRIEDVIQPKKPVIEPTTDVSRIKDQATNIKSPEEFKAVDTNIDMYLTDLKARVEATGQPFSKIVDEIESGNISKGNEGFAKEIENFYKQMMEVGKERRSIFPGYIPGYWHQIRPDADTGLRETSFGEVLFDASYSKERKGLLEEYIKDIDAMRSYAREAIGTSDPEKAVEIKLAQDIINKVQQRVEADAKGNVEGAKPKARKSDVLGDYGVNIVEEIRGKLKPNRPLTTYKKLKVNKLEDIFGKVLRSVHDRTIHIGDQKFYNDFLDPFYKAQAETGVYLKELEGLKPEDIRGEYEAVFNYPPKQGMTEDAMLARLLNKERKRLNGIAADTYRDNVRNMDIADGDLLKLVEDIGTEHIVKDIAIDSLGKKLAGKTRAMVGRAALGFNIGSSINNIFETKRIAALTSTDAVKKALNRYASGERVTEYYGIDSMRGTALERGNMNKVWEAGDKALFYLFDKSEKLKDDIMLLALEEQGKNKGLEGEALRQFVQKKFYTFAIKYGKGQDIGLYQNDIMKTLGQFGQYAMKDLMILADQTRGAIKGDKGSQAYVAKYAAYSAAQMALFNAVLGTIGFGGQTGTPLDFLTNFAKGDSLLSSPIVQLSLDLYQHMTADENELEADRLDREKRLWRTVNSSIIPAGNQIGNKTLGYGQRQKDGYYTTRSGNVANEVSRDPVSQGKGYIFGPAYDPKRQEYINNLDEAPFLDKNQSAMYRGLPENERTEYYNAQKEINKGNEEFKKLEKTLQGKDEGKGLLSSLFGKKEEVQVGVGTLSDTATPQEIKAYNKRFSTFLDNGYEDQLTVDDISTRYFRKDKADASDIEQREEAYKTLKTIMENEELSEEYKKKALQASGTTQEDYDYYSLAKGNVRKRREEMIKAISGIEDREVLIGTLGAMRKSVAGSKTLSNEDVDYLYDMGVISKDEKSYLNYIKYDELTGKFYMDRDWKGSSEGSGGGQTAKQKKASLDKLMKALESNSKSSTSYDLIKKLLAGINNISGSGGKDPYASIRKALNSMKAPVQKLPVKKTA
jgi:ABC-type transporter MlaC component